MNISGLEVENNEFTAAGTVADFHSIPYYPKMDRHYEAKVLKLYTKN